MPNHTTELEALQARVQASYGAFLMLEFDAALPYPEGARKAAMARLTRAWSDPEMLTHALRAEHLTEQEAHALAKADRAAFDQLLAEDEARDARARMKRNDEEAA